MPACRQECPPHLAPPGGSLQFPRSAKNTQRLQEFRDSSRPTTASGNVILWQGLRCQGEDREAAAEGSGVVGRVGALCVFSSNRGDDRSECPQRGAMAAAACVRITISTR